MMDVNIDMILYFYFYNINTEISKFIHFFDFFDIDTIEH